MEKTITRLEPKTSVIPRKKAGRRLRSRFQRQGRDDSLVVRAG